MLIPIRIDRTSKPPIGTPLRSDGHWGVQGLIGAWAFNEGSGATAFDSVNKHPPTLANILGTNGLRATGPNQGLVVPVSKSVNSMLGLTVFWKGVVLGDSVGLGNPSLANVTYDSSDSSPYSGICIQRISSVQGEIRFSWNIAASYRELNIPCINYGRQASYAIGIGNQGATVYANGVVTGSGNGGTPILTASSIVVFGTHPTVRTQYANTETYCTYIYNTTLTTQQIASLSANPWQIYEPETVWVEVGGTEAEVPITSASALMMGM